jgi:hypothetical protein
VSKAFTKDEAWEEPIIPPRAPMSAGVQNYVTPPRASAVAGGVVVVDPHPQPHDQVRFGASVTLRAVDGERAGEERRLEIVGIDEADAAHGRMASPRRSRARFSGAKSATPSRSTLRAARIYSRCSRSTTRRSEPTARSRARQFMS